MSTPDTGEEAIIMRRHHWIRGVGTVILPVQLCYRKH